MSEHADTIRQALQGAMVGKWGRENALRALLVLESENQRLRDALEIIAEDEYAGSLPHVIAIHALKSDAE